MKHEKPKTQPLLCDFWITKDKRSKWNADHAIDCNLLKYYTDNS